MSVDESVYCVSTYNLIPTPGRFSIAFRPTLPFPIIASTLKLLQTTLSIFQAQHFPLRRFITLPFHCSNSECQTLSGLCGGLCCGRGIEPSVSSSTLHLFSFRSSTWAKLCTFNKLFYKVRIEWIHKKRCVCVCVWGGGLLTKMKPIQSVKEGNFPILQWCLKSMLNLRIQ